jgi:hypothetical protein
MKEGSSQKKTSVQTPWLWTSLQKCDEINSCCFSLMICSIQLQMKYSMNREDKEASRAERTDLYCSLLYNTVAWWGGDPVQWLTK